MRRSLSTATATIAALTLLMASVLPAAALTFKGTGFYARFGPSMATDVRGLVVGDRLRSDDPRLTVGLVGLLPHAELTIAGRSIGCNGTPGAGNRIFRIEATADASGDAFLTRIMAEWSRTDLRSVWIDWGDGAVCQLSLNFEEIKFNITATYNADAALSLTKVGTGTLVLLIEKRPEGRARLSLSGTGIAGTGALRIRGANTQCGTAPTSTPFAVTFKDVLVSSFRSKVIDLTQNQLDALRSVRINRLSGNNTWCGPLSLIIVVV